MAIHSFSHLFYLPPDTSGTLSDRIREMLVDVILGGRHPIDQPLPSSRRLALQLGVARNTVTAVYFDLVQDDLLVSRERSGYFINPEIASQWAAAENCNLSEVGEQAANSGIDWQRRTRLRPSRQPNISKPEDWQSYPFPFISGQIDPARFPIAEWRECSRKALRCAALADWSSDTIADDDPELIEQIRTRLLPRRGIHATPDEILITVGSQNALYMLSQVLIDNDTPIGIEDPGYPDARNIFLLRTDKVINVPVDRDGVVVGPEMNKCRYLYVTPSHQCPTTVTMPLSRREQLLEAANRNNIVVLEDDYDSEVNFAQRPSPALKSMDRDGRIIYFSSVSKTLAPGLRIGYMVAPPALIREIRALRRLMMRGVPANNQRTLALFIAQGSYDSLSNRLRNIYRRRRETLVSAINRHLPNCKLVAASGGSSVWIQGPAGLDSELLCKEAEALGILVEPGSIYFSHRQPRCRWLRIGFSAISEEQIEPGIKLLAPLVSASRPSVAAS